MRTILAMLCLFMLASCAQGPRPASQDAHPVAYASIAQGNVTAAATKRPEKGAVCFEINMLLKNVEQKSAQATNWTVAWVDHQDRYHLIKMHQRNPASPPEHRKVVQPNGTYPEWKNSFTACAPKARPGEVKKLVLTPKSLPYGDSKSLQLTW